MFIDLLLQLTGMRFNDEQLKAEATTIMASVRVLFHTFELFTFIAFLSGRAETAVCTEQSVSCPGHEANH
jgi:hypothetical protein